MVGQLLVFDLLVLQIVYRLAKLLIFPKGNQPCCLG